MKDADVMLALGPRLGEIATGAYTRLVPPVPAQRLIHVHADADELGRVYRPALAIAARPEVFVRQLADAVRPPATDRSARVAEARASFESWRVPEDTAGDVRMERVITHLDATLPEDAIVTNGAGNYTAWLHRYYAYKSYRTQLAPTSGSMGYGLPAAIAAKLRAPDREVICLAGDGCFQMTSQEFGTACQYGANVVVILSNNGIYGTIRMHQERDLSGPRLGNDHGQPGFRGAGPGAWWLRRHGDAG